MKYKLQTCHKKLLADTLTPVNIYLKLRDVFAGSILLESSDYHGHENSLSLICCDALASFVVNGDEVECSYPDGTSTTNKITNLADQFEEFRNSFEPDSSVSSKYVSNGLFGYMSYDTVRFFE